MRRKYLLLILVLGFSFISSIEVYGLSKLTTSGIKLYWHNKDLDYAKKLLNDGLKMPYRSDAQKSYIYLFLGRIALVQGELEEADINFNQSMNLYSNPYPYLIYTEYYQNNNDSKKAEYYLKKGLNWYETRASELLADSFDITQLHFWSRYSPLDNSLDEYEIYKVMYDAKAPQELRCLTYLQFCLSSMSELRELGVKHNYLEPSRYTFYNIDGSDESQSNLSLFKDGETQIFRLSFSVEQQKDGVNAGTTNLVLLGQVDKNGNCFFVGAEGKQYPLSCLHMVDNILEE